MKEYQNALVDWERLLEIAPEYPLVGNVQFWIGNVHLWLKELLQATTCFTRSYELAPTEDMFLWAREWCAMCQTPPDLYTLRYLEAMANGDRYTAYLCRGVIFFLQKKFQQALREFQHAPTLHYEDSINSYYWADHWRAWDVPFWLGMVYLALNQEEEARRAIEQALAVEMPPILLKPLCWFEHAKPKLYERLVKPLFAANGL
jgi:tetratricopeptide (TPR) repeat protein